jgi:hypothetical protein
MKTEFELFIQSIGFVYSETKQNRDYYKLLDYELYITTGGIYHISKLLKSKFTPSIIIKSDMVKSYKNNLEVFKSILREVKLNNLGIN